VGTGRCTGKDGIPPRRKEGAKVHEEEGAENRKGKAQFFTTEATERTEKRMREKIG
jgi:hypothetical protein